MKLLCTISQEQLAMTAPDVTTLSHRLFFDFAARIGGNTECIKRYESYLKFPNIGDEKVLYIDTGSNKLYQWNNTNLHYYVIGSDYNQIEIIDGGNA